MKANLYLHPDAFKHNGVDSEIVVTKKLQCLANDMKDIVYKHSEDNIFYITTSLYDVNVYENKGLVDFVQEHLDVEDSSVLFSMMANVSSDFDEVSIDELEKKCVAYYSEEEANSMVIINRKIEEQSEEQKKLSHKAITSDYISFDRYEVVYDKNSWITFRRQILGNHPGNATTFIEDCRKYFCNISFHDNCIETLKDENYDYLKACPRRIVYYLSCLNDKFKDTLDKYELGKVDPNNILSDFSGTYGLGESGSMQQNYEKKASLTFDFCNTDAKTKSSIPVIKVLCEPHLKIPRPDENYTGTWNDKNFHPRIYFNFERKENIEDGKFLVGIIGQHI